MSVSARSVRFVNYVLLITALGNILALLYAAHTGSFSYADAIVRINIAIESLAIPGSAFLASRRKPERKQSCECSRPDPTIRTRRDYG